MIFGHTVATSFATAADAEWEGVLHAMKWIDNDNRKRKTATKT
jgi:hypothetical protein